VKYVWTILCGVLFQLAVALDSAFIPGAVVAGFAAIDSIVRGALRAR
jgi:hypothetical protein